MDSLVKAFENTELGFNIDIYNINQELFFKGAETGKTLGYTNPHKAIRDHVPEKHKVKLNDIITDEERTKRSTLTSNDLETIYITEVGLYALIMRSKLKVAIQFQDWVYDTIKKSDRLGHTQYRTPFHC